MNDGKRARAWYREQSARLTVHHADELAESLRAEGHNVSWVRPLFCDGRGTHKRFYFLNAIRTILPDGSSTIWFHGMGTHHQSPDVAIPTIERGVVIPGQYDGSTDSRTSHRFLCGRCQRDVRVDEDRLRSLLEMLGDTPPVDGIPVSVFG